MNKKGPIIIIEDDLDDQRLLMDVFQELAVANEILYFINGEEGYNYLQNSSAQPFLIMCDINMPKLNGFELREKIHNNEQLRLKCIPYVFFTTSAEQNMVVTAYSKSVQGFFAKPRSYKHLLRMINNIIEYWKDCQSPDIVI